MSTIKVDTVQSRGGGAVTLTNQSAASTFCEYEQSTPTIGTSLNISTVTDSSTGSYVLNFNTAYSSQTARCTAACGINKGSANVYIAGPNDTNTASGSYESKTDGGTNNDSTNGLQIHGDLA